MERESGSFSTQDAPDPKMKIDDGFNWDFELDISEFDESVIIQSTVPVSSSVQNEHKK